MLKNLRRLRRANRDRRPQLVDGSRRFGCPPLGNLVLLQLLQLSQQMRRLFPSPPDGPHRRFGRRQARMPAAQPPLDGLSPPAWRCLRSWSCWVAAGQAAGRRTANSVRPAVAARERQDAPDWEPFPQSRATARPRRTVRESPWTAGLTNHVGTFARLFRRLSLDDSGFRRRQATNFKFGRRRCPGRGWDQARTLGHRAIPALRRSSREPRRRRPLLRPEEAVKPAAAVALGAGSTAWSVGLSLGASAVTATFTGSSTGAAAGTTSGTGDFATAAGTTMAGRVSLLAEGRNWQGSRRCWRRAPPA